MTSTWPQNPVDSVQVPQTVGLSPEVAFNVVGQSGLAPMFQVQAVADQPLPGVATQWGQTPASFAGQQPVPQPPLASWPRTRCRGPGFPRGSVLYMEWVEGAPPPKKAPRWAG